MGEGEGEEGWIKREGSGVWMERSGVRVMKDCKEEGGTRDGCGLLKDAL